MKLRRSASPGLRLPLWPIAIPAVVALLLFAHTLGYPFLWDDWAVVVDNRDIQNLAHLPVLFTKSAFAGLDNSVGVQAGGYYRPVWIVTVAIDHAIWGNNPFGYHLTGLLLHALATTLVSWIVLELSASRVAACAAGLLFAVHPVHVEPVTWIAARNELLLCPLLLASFGAYLRLRRGLTPWSIVCVGCFVVALFTKETAVVFPALLALHELTLGNSGAGSARSATDRATRPDRRVRGAPATARAPSLIRRLGWPLGLAVLALGFWALRSHIVAGIRTEGDWTTRIASAPILTLTYLQLLFVPVGLRLFHEFEPVHALATMRFAIPALALVTIVVLAVWRWRRAPLTVFALGWVMVSIAPFVGIAGLLRPTPIAERYLYLPSVGWALIVADWVARWVRASDRGQRRVTGWSRLGVAALALVALAFAGASVRESRSWRNEDSFMARMAQDAVHHPFGHDAMGLVHRRKQEWSKAAAEFATAVRMDPEDPRYVFHLAGALEKLGQLDAAKQAFQASIDRHILFPEAHFELGWILERQGQFDQALEHYRAAVAVDPTFGDAHAGAGLLLQRMGRSTEARRAMEAAIRVEPNDARHHLALSTLQMEAGEPSAGIGELREAVRLRPDWPKARFALASALSTQGLLAEAEQSARSGIEFDPQSGEGRLLLGSILAAQGRLGEAMAQYREAGRLANNDDLKRAIEGAIAEVTAATGN